MSQKTKFFEEKNLESPPTLFHLYHGKILHHTKQIVIFKKETFVYAIYDTNQDNNKNLYIMNYFS